MRTSIKTTMFLFMNKYLAPIPAFLEKYNKSVRFVALLLAMFVVAYSGNLFAIENKIVNKAHLSGDILDFQSFMGDLNLPGNVGALFVTQRNGYLEKMEKRYDGYENGEIFTNQLRSLLGTEITEESMSRFINGMFGVSAMLFSIMAGQLIFKSEYASLAIFIPIVVFRNYSQGLIYGIPDKHAYPVFYPLLAFCLFVILIRFMQDRGKKYWAVLIMCGFVLAYMANCKKIDGGIVVVSTILFAVAMSLKDLMVDKVQLKKAMFGVVFIFTALGIGCIGYFGMLKAFEFHRDYKLELPVVESRAYRRVTVFYDLYVSLFRFAKPGRVYSNPGYEAVLEKYPELKGKYGRDYQPAIWSTEYNNDIKKLYIEYVSKHKDEFFEYLRASIYDYILFLPYFSWTGVKSVPAYLPKIDDTMEIKSQDLASGYEGLDWILNLDEDYLPQGLLFKIYFVVAYLLLAEAVLTAFFNFGKHRVTSSGEIADSALPIYLLRGMLVYFFFASVQRILVPLHGHGAAVAFNVIVIYNLARIAAGERVRLPAIRMPSWSWLLAIFFVTFLVLRVLNWEQVFKGNLVANGEFEHDANGWVAYKADLRSVSDSQSGKVLMIRANEGKSDSYAYTTVPTHPGKKYVVRAYYKKGNIESKIIVGTMFNSEDIYSSGAINNSDWKLYIARFTAITPITYLTLVNRSYYKGELSYFDSVSISEVDDKP